jgi:hypothetical protein
LASSLNQPLQLGVLQQHNRFSVLDFPGFYHLQRLIQTELDELDLFAVIDDTATRALPLCRGIWGRKKWIFSVTEPGLI